MNTLSDRGRVGEEEWWQGKGGRERKRRKEGKSFFKKNVFVEQVTSQLGPFS